MNKTPKFSRGSIVIYQGTQHTIDDIYPTNNGYRTDIATI
jgi:hypothetical protein